VLWNSVRVEFKSEKNFEDVKISILVPPVGVIVIVVSD
jgi:hypothetical protein